MESKHFRPYEPDQSLLLPPSLNDWLPEDPLAFFIRDVVGELDLSAILKDYEGSKGGQPPYHPRMMVRLLLYAYCVRVPSSRKIEKATHERVPFRVISANQHPDHDTICEVRRRPPLRTKCAPRRVGGSVLGVSSRCPGMSPRT